MFSSLYHFYLSLFKQNTPKLGCVLGERPAPTTTLDHLIFVVLRKILSQRLLKVVSIIVYTSFVSCFMFFILAGCKLGFGVCVILFVMVK